MIKAILIDDEPLSREILKNYLARFSQIVVAAECNDGFEGVKAIQQYQPDLVFLDIQMPKINGFEMLELVAPLPAVIFITAFDEFALKAFEANAIDYLLKPVSEARFAKAVQKFLDKSLQPVAATTRLLDTMSAHAQNNRIVVKTGSRVKIIPVHEIEYLEADDDFVKIVTAEGAFLKNKTLAFYEQSLDPQQFVRVHRSYLLRISQIAKIEPYQKETHLAILRNGKQIPISKTGYGKLKVILGI
ncbi:MAG: LytTR family transcriptional regulator DNA-binding domain-containing protein [Cyclobacteriaceae bacterium]|nr:LytTR family transcriptional regulator DNA-binding domain-containing protein [Cytophagales bacterium]MBX2899399.1 LytTR family transcriptional regulator DNA-binding domain-containing protein [Cyclobacteriaceae bacterium]